MFATKTVTHWIKNYLEILQQHSSDLAPEMLITKETKQPVILLPWQWLCSWSCLETEILSSCLNQRPSTPPNLMMGVKTIWEPRLFPAGCHFKLFKIRIFGFWEKAWSQDFFLGNDTTDVIWSHLWCTFLVPSLKSISFNISRDVLYSVFCHFSCKPHEVITFLISIIQKSQYL